MAVKDNERRGIKDVDNAILTHSQHYIRGTDSNSLLRLYDQVNELLTRSLPQAQRIRAGKAVERIAKELERRKIRM